MAPRALLPVVVAAPLVVFGTAFIGGSAPRSGRHLRSTVEAYVVTAEMPSGAGSSSGFGNACLAGSFLAAATAAALRRRTARCAEEIAVTKEVERNPLKMSQAELQEWIPRPENLPESPRFPMYGGSMGGYMSKVTTERHAITWTSKEEHLFEMNGTWAMMNKGENLCYFRRKEQCIAVGKELRKLKIENYKIYRLKSDGTVVFMHPADGVFPEKVNKGRVQVNGRPFTVGQNCSPGELMGTMYEFKNYEADPLTTLFVKARLQAFQDPENLFPNPEVIETPETEEDKAAFRDFVSQLKGARPPVSI